MGSGGHIFTPRPSSRHPAQRLAIARPRSLVLPGRVLWVIMVLGACVVGAPTRCWAQADIDQALLPARAFMFDELRLPVDPRELEVRTEELRLWIRQYSDWRAWREEWRKRGANIWRDSRDSRQKPDPPRWLFDECRGLVEGTGALADGCRLLLDWRDDYVTGQVRQEIATERAQREAPTKTRWWEHVHIDALWPMTQWGANVYGIIGVHATVEVAGRFQVFILPGAILLNMPGDQGTRRWTPATDWGLAYRLFDFQLPGTKSDARLHLNIAKAWVPSGTPGIGNISIDLVGFSITLKNGHKS